MTAKYRSAISKAKGLGSSKDGLHHWVVQRLTAIALIPLTLWFCFSVASMTSFDHAALVNWMSSMFNAGLMICTIIAGLYHGALGCQVIIEDYVSDHAVRMVGIITVKGLCFLFAVIGVLSVVKLAVGG